MPKSHQFYNKVAKKFKGYKSGTQKIVEFPYKDPEEIFKDFLIKYSGKNKTALDLGCADGRFTLKITSYFKKIIGIDMAEDMLNIGKKSAKQLNIKNIKFEKADAYNLPYKPKTFDLVYSRRGPTEHKEISKVLKSNGYFVEIRVGEQDCREIKEVFGRGQDFGKWNQKVLATDKVKLKKHGFKTISAKEYFYSEFYKDYENLDLFLQSVPIFEDFDSTKDKPLLEKYVKNFKSNKGVQLKRHRIVFVAKKN
ncbi:hypothetical protein CL633_01360 [bacterium]|nr:hypothetical protein [bacterium]|tara:strand:+ start:14584 stop:15339 length:756 start_codon:yes stop_codon:yes gene_type:complete